MPTTLESYTSLPLVFIAHLWFFSNHQTKPRENKKIPDLSLLRFPNHLDTFNPWLSYRALLWNRATVQERPGTREISTGHGISSMWKKKKKNKGKGTKRRPPPGAHSSTNCIDAVLGDCLVHGGSCLSPKWPCRAVRQVRQWMHAH